MVILTKALTSETCRAGLDRPLAVTLARQHHLRQQRMISHQRHHRQKRQQREENCPMMQCLQAPSIQNHQFQQRKVWSTSM